MIDLAPRLLFKEDQELQPYLGVSATFSISDIRDPLDKVQSEIIVNLVGQEQFDVILDKYQDNEDQLSDKEKELLHLLRHVLAGFAFQKYIPKLMLDISTSGIRINVNENYKTAFQWQIDLLEQSVERDAHFQYEKAFGVFTKNKTDFPLYWHSDAFQINNRYFINLVRDFDRFRNIRGLRPIFLAMQTVMETVEEIDIKSILGKTLFADLKRFAITGYSSISGSDAIVEVSETSSETDPEINTHYNQLIYLVKFIIANLTFGRAVNDLNLVYDEKGFLVFNTNNTQTTKAFQPAQLVQVSNVASNAQLMADRYIKELKTYLFENALEIPLYTKPETNDLPTVQQKEEYGFFTGIGIHK